MSLITQTRTFDDDFVNTWYTIQKDAVDNILDATVFTLALKEYGVLKPQVGGTYGWTGTPRYGTKSTQRFQEGSTVTQEPKQLVTMAFLNWRYYCVDINRSLIDDSKNMGPNQIRSYIADRFEAARDALVQDFETMMFQWGAYYAAPLQPNGIYDITPPNSAISTSGDGSSSDTYATGTSNGGISRATNTWWRPWIAYDDATQANANKIAGPTNEPYALNLVADIEHMFNTIGANMEKPNFIITSQAIYEAYKEENRDKLQIVRTSFNTKAADLGFDTVTWNGATFTWTNSITSNYVIFLNMNHLDLNYHPNVWYEMTPWKDAMNSFDRVAYIVCMTPGLATSQPRRHGMMNYAS
jgi:hypothetical protein